MRDAVMYLGVDTIRSLSLTAEAFGKLSPRAAADFSLDEQARERRAPIHIVEQEADGVTHADIGAQLLLLWGLPDPIVEAVAHHHDPALVNGLAFDGIAAVHIANGLANELVPAADGEAPLAGLDVELIDRLGVRPRLDLWRSRARELADLVEAR